MSESERLAKLVREWIDWKTDQINGMMDWSENDGFCEDHNISEADFDYLTTMDLVVSEATAPTIIATMIEPTEQDSGAISGRLLCEIFGDMRDCLTTTNFSYLKGLIEEAQYRANRMEDRLMLISNVSNLESRRIQQKTMAQELEKEIHELQLKKDALTDEVGEKK